LYIQIKAEAAEVMVMEEINDNTPVQKEKLNDNSNDLNNDNNENRNNSPINDRKTRKKGGKSIKIEAESSEILEIYNDLPKWGTSLNQCTQCKTKITKINDAIALITAKEIALVTAKEDLINTKNITKINDIVDIKNLNIIESEKCRICDEYGDDDLISCLGCSYKYHIKCSGVTYTPCVYIPRHNGNGDYRCQLCLDKMVISNEFTSHLGSDSQALGMYINIYRHIYMYI
jgi:hypothetical protein